MQLINSSIYDKESEIRNKAIEQTRQRKTLERDRREKHKLHKHLQSLAANTEKFSFGKSAEAHPIVFEIMIGGLCFHVIDGGSKLLRKSSKYLINFVLAHINHLLDPAEPPRSTPKRAIVGGVSFLRSKHGNLYRSGLVKAKRCVSHYWSYNRSSF